MKAMRRQVFENDIDRWARTFLDDLESLNGKSATKAVG
jgi:trehalose-6-phosphate synthase